MELHVSLRLTALTVSVLLTSISSAGAQNGGDRQHGHVLARSVCAACHAVELGQRHSPNHLAPSFLQIANTPGMTALALRVALRSPHPVMPNLKTTETELVDLVAYIQSLKTERP